MLMGSPPMKCTNQPCTLKPCPLYRVLRAWKIKLKSLCKITVTTSESGTPSPSQMLRDTRWSKMRRGKYYVRSM